jgi:thymidylate synthase
MATARIVDDLCLVDIDAITIPDAWFQCIYQILHYGRKYTIDRGSFAGQQRLEFDYITASISKPGFGADSDINNMLPRLREGISIPNPVEEGYLNDYLPYLMTGELKPGESYTYGQRLNKCPIPFEWIVNYDSGKHAYCSEDFTKVLTQDRKIYENNKIIHKEKNKETYKANAFFNQIEFLIYTYKRYGFKNNQMVLQIAQPSDMFLQDPPCLRLIDTRILNNKLHFFVEFRSWDLWAGFPANLAAIEILKQYIAGELNVETGVTIARSKGLHIYNYTWELAEIVANKTMSEAQESIMDLKNAN